jgi:hypothetical protein
MKLCRELKQGEIYIDYQTSGVWEHVIAWNDIVPENYEDVTGIEYIHDNKKWLLDNNYINDYDVVKNFMTQICSNTGWENSSNTLKEHIINYNAYDNNTDKVIFLMTVKGLTQLEASEFLVEKWAWNNDNLVDSLQQRFHIVKKELGKRIIKADLEDLTLTHELLILRLTNYGLLGLNYGSDSDGMMDYIESTNGYIGNGLTESGYTFINPSDTWQAIVSMVKDILVNGNYTLNIE